MIHIDDMEISVSTDSCNISMNSANKVNINNEENQDCHLKNFDQVKNSVHSCSNDYKSHSETHPLLSDYTNSEYIKFIDEDDDDDEDVTDHQILHPASKEAAAINIQSNITNPVEKLSISEKQCAIDINEKGHYYLGYSDKYDTEQKTFHTERDHYMQQYCVEMTDMSNTSHKATANNDGNDELKKKNKKRRKSKLKSDASLENITTVKTLGIPQKFYDNQDFTKAQEVQPLLRRDPNNNRKKPYGSSDSASTSKEKRNPKENPLATYLTDEKVREILEMCGDTQTHSGNGKKKAKDNRNGLPKKEKKKTKKPKKNEKKKEPQQNEISDAEDTSTITKSLTVEEITPITNVEESNINIPVSDEDQEDFILQRRKKMSHKHSVSGRTSPHKPESARRRRYSDPSPSVPSSESTGQNSERLKSQRVKEKWESDVNTNTRNEVYDRTSRAQWPTLSTHSDVADVKNVNGSSSASYASKLKMNMDSTGCSLASSSEETSSSSSSSNNYQTRSNDDSSPVHDPLLVLSDISKYIHEAAGFVSKSKCETVEQSSMEEHPRIKDVEPLHISDNVIENKITLDADSITEKEIGSIQYLKSSDGKSSDPLKTVINTSRKAFSPVVFPHVNNVDEEANYVECFSVTPSSKDASYAKIIDGCTQTILNKLQNKWGLEFFVADAKEPVESRMELPIIGHLKKEVTFGVGKFQIGNISDTDAICDVGMSLSSYSKLNFEVNVVPRCKPGDFDKNKATAILYREWEKALEKGIFYKNL